MLLTTLIPVLAVPRNHSTLLPQFTINPVPAYNFSKLSAVWLRGYSKLVLASLPPLPNCHYQCNWLHGKTRVLSGTLNTTMPYHTYFTYKVLHYSSMLTCVKSVAALYKSSCFNSVTKKCTAHVGLLYKHLFLPS